MFKKIISLVIVLAMGAAVLTACGEKEPVNLTMGQTLLADFKDMLKNDPDMSAEDIAQALLENEVIEFAGMSVPMQEGYFAGIKTEIGGFEAAASFGPMIGSIAFAGYIFTLADDANVSDFITLLKDNADPRWNICVEADETIVENVGNTVFFLMSPIITDTEE